MIQWSFTRSSLGAKLRDRLDPVGWSYCWGMLSWSHRWWNIYITVSFYMYYKHLWHLYSFLGVLPLWVIPAKALGTAPSAPADDNLKYLLAFAGAPIFLLGCFCLVVLSLLPFAPFLSVIWKPLYSWRLTWWCFSSPPPRNISTRKGEIFWLLLRFWEF